jgi:hypothetical protein
MSIEGVGGRSLHDEWQGHAHAYLGLTVNGFPNFFMMYGPNTNLGHNSIIFMIECQTQYIMGCLRQMDARDLGTITLRQDVLDAYNAALQRELAGTVWAATSNSWYKTADGTITNNWSGTTFRYWLKTRRADLACYDVTRACTRARRERTGLRGMTTARDARRAGADGRQRSRPRAGASAQAGRARRLARA